MGKTFFEGLRPASFRGVPFEVESHSASGGRRLARHEFPLRDAPYAEDLGRKAGEWQVDAFIVNIDSQTYAEARDKLREALAATGPGSLIHPWLGELTVAVDGFTVKETTQEGGYCAFSITFVEAGHAAEPDTEVNTQAAVHAQAAGAKDAVQAEFTNSFHPLLEDFEALADVLPHLLDSALDYLTVPLSVAQRVASTLQAATRVLAAPAALAGSVLGCLALARSLFDLKLAGLDHGVLTSLLARRKPDPRWANFAPAGSGNAGSGGGGAGNAGSGSGGSGGSISGGLGGSDVTASTLQNRAVTPLAGLIAAGVVIEAATAAAEADYATADDALTARDAVLEGIEAVLAAHCPDPVFFALSDLAVAVQQDLTGRGARLPRLGTARLNAAMPALAAAYRLYGDVERADELVARNHVRHPGRVPGGVDLEVLRGD